MYPIRRRGIQAVIPVFLVLAGPSNSGGQDLQSHDPLTLSEAWVVPLPSHIELVDLSVGPTGEFLLHATNGIWYLGSRQDTIRYIGSFESLDVVGLWVDGQVFEVFDRGTGRVVSVDLIGFNRSWISVSPPRSVVSAARSSCGWITVSPESNGDSGIKVRLGSAEKPDWEFQLPWFGGKVRAVDNFVSVTEVVPPFRGLVLTCTDPTETRQDLIGIPWNLDGSTTWRSLPIFPHRDRLIRTLADLASDERRFIVYGSTGHLLQMSTVSAPLALVTSIRGDTVIGVRRLETVEIVGFRGWG